MATAEQINAVNAQSLARSIDQTLNDRLKDFKQHASEMAAGLPEGRTRWFRPQSGWNDDLTDMDSIHEAFSRDEANRNFVDAVKEELRPGTNPDIMSSALSIEVLAGMERAFMLRHGYDLPRSTALIAGRYAGHANDRGPLGQRVKEYLLTLIRRGM